MPPPAARLSPLDAAFLYFERPHQRLHVGCVALLEAGVPFEDLVRAVDERLGVLPRYRQRPVRPLLDLGWPRWEADPTYDVRRHVRHVGVPAPGGERELRELLGTLFSTPLDPRHPLWEAYLIDGLAGGRAALLCKVHHSMIDGVSGAQVLGLLADPGPTSARRASAPPPAPRPGRRALLGGLPSPATILAGVRDAVEAAGTLATLVLAPPSPLPFHGPLTDARRVVWATFPLDDFLAVRGVAGCKVNDVVLAVIAGALRRHLLARGVAPEGVRVRSLVPVSVRGEAEYLRLGNLVTAMFPELPVGVADPVERLRRTAAETRSLKERGQARASGLALELAGRLPPPLGALLGWLLPERPALSTVCTNVPGPHEPCHLLGRRIVEVHPIVPLFQSMGLEFAVLSYAGRLSICAAADPHLVPDADGVAAALVAAADELVGAVGGGRRAAPRARAPEAGPRVADLMTREVLTLGAEDSLASALHLMRERRIRHLPVIASDGRLLGLVTHRDVLAAAPSPVMVPVEADRVRVLRWARAADFMETHLSVATPDEPAAEAGARLVRHKIGCLPVLGEGGQLAGIVTEEDFLRWATERMAQAG
jgi:diacylglycerol O-acyltransferase